MKHDELETRRQNVVNFALERDSAERKKKKNLLVILVFSFVLVLAATGVAIGVGYEHNTTTTRTTTASPATSTTAPLSQGIRYHKEPVCGIGTTVCRPPGVWRGRRQEISGDTPRRRQQLQLARPARGQELALPGGLASLRGRRSCCQADRDVKRTFAY